MYDVCTNPSHRLEETFVSSQTNSKCDGCILVADIFSGQNYKIPIDMG